MTNPALFISHGAPTLPFDDVQVHHFFKGLADTLPRPTAILVISAHWMTARPTVSSATQPETIHDFYGFPEKLYQLRYPAPGAPDVAARVAALLRGSGITCDIDPSRGLDHGAWNPLLMIYPNADIPVLQLSIQPDESPAHHIALGKALAPLRDEGVLILASGSTTHNLAAWRENRHLPDGEAPEWVTDFADWVAANVESGGTGALEAYESHPHGLDNHPSNDHILPLFVVLGAGGDPAKVIHRSNSYGVLAMDAYAFG